MAAWDFVFVPGSWCAVRQQGASPVPLKVRQAVEQVARLQQGLTAVSSSRAETERTLQELQQRHTELSDAAGTDVSLTISSGVHNAARWASCVGPTRLQSVHVGANYR